MASAQVTMRWREVTAQETDGMAAQRQPDMAIILDHFAAGGHGPERHRGFAEFQDSFCRAGCGDSEGAAAARRAAP
jgi:hypothetical protein